MKKHWVFTLLIAFVAFCTLPSCHRGSGCPAAELGPKTNKRGELKAGKKSKSSLFPKGMKKKMGK